MEKCHPAIVLKLAIVCEFVVNDNLSTPSQCCVWDVLKFFSYCMFIC